MNDDLDDSPRSFSIGATRLESRRSRLVALARAEADVDQGERMAAVPLAGRVRPTRYALPLALAAAFVVAVPALVVTMDRPATVQPAVRRLSVTPVMLALPAEPSTSGAASVLLRLATTAESQPRPAPGRYQYVRSSSWNLMTQVSRERGVISRVVADSTETWTDSAGNGWVRGTVQGRPTNAAQNGRSAMYDVAQMSDDPRVLAAQLAVGHPTEYGAAERIVAITDLWRDRVPDPKLQGALLRVLAAEDGIVVRGRTTDRAGRPGVAISADSDFQGLPTRFMLVIDPRTGMILDYEQILTTTAGALKVRIPAVIGYSVWQSHGNVDALRALPTAADQG